MELIKELYDNDLGIQSKVEGDVRYRLRKAARALIFRDKNIAVLNVKSLSLHQLPGGGIEDNESVREGLEREVLEETGCNIGQVEEFGVVIEYRREIELIQISYVFTGNVIGDLREPVFTQEEVDEGCVLEWMTVDEAIDAMRFEDKQDTYAGKFRRARDMAILEYYLKRK